MNKVMAIATQSFSKIEVYGIGILLDNNRVKLDSTGQVVDGCTTCPLENWVELVDETDAEVEIIPYAPKKNLKKLKNSLNFLLTFAL